VGQRTEDYSPRPGSKQVIIYADLFAIIHPRKEVALYVCYQLDVNRKQVVYEFKTHGIAKKNSLLLAFYFPGSMENRATQWD